MLWSEDILVARRKSCAINVNPYRLLILVVKARGDDHLSFKLFAQTRVCTLFAKNAGCDEGFQF
jgi:hypothetical protein